jgi:diacylglycerol kinase family enzyme
MAKILDAADSKQKVEVVATERAGHAEVLAYELAQASRNPLIISASGDGGYNEVINGLMKAQSEGAKSTAGLLPAGNANDHFSSLHEKDFVEAVINGKSRRIDLLKLVTTRNDQPLERYAHSYIGLGLTSQAGRELNKNQLNMFKEAWIVLRVLLWLRPVRLSINSQVRSYDSLVFSNIDRMSKIFSVSKKAKANDGKFEMSAFPSHGKFKLIMSLLKAGTMGLSNVEQIDKFKFQTLRPTLIQLDGEITTIDTGAQTTIKLEKSVLDCIV